MMNSGMITIVSRTASALAVKHNLKAKRFAVFRLISIDSNWQGIR